MQAVIRHEKTCSFFDLTANQQLLIASKAAALRAQLTRCEGAIIAEGVKQIGDKISLKTEVGKELKRFDAAAKLCFDGGSNPQDSLMPQVLKRALDAVKFKDH